jgi:hypothetical protein
MIRDYFCLYLRLSIFFVLLFIYEPKGVQNKNNYEREWPQETEGEGKPTMREHPKRYQLFKYFINYFLLYFHTICV